MPEPQTVLSRRSALTYSALTCGALLGAAAVTGTALAAPAAATPRTGSAPSRVPVQEGVLDVGGASLWYWDTGGTGPAVILLHAGSGSGLNWDHQQHAFARAGYRVIGYSRRGHYGSSPVDPADPGVGAEDLRILADALGVGAFHLLGIAAGGITALDFAVSYPQRLRSLVIACSIFLVQDPEYLQTMEGLRPPEFDALPTEVKELGPGYRATNPDGVAEWLELHEKSQVPGSSGRQALANEVSWSDIERLPVNALLLTGDADLYMPPALLRTVIAPHFRCGRTAVISNSGHAANWEQPEDFNRTVLGFLRRHRS